MEDVVQWAEYLPSFYQALGSSLQLRDWLRKIRST